MEKFGEWHTRPTPVAVPRAETGAWEEETEWDSLFAEGGTDVCLVECREDSKQMSPDTIEVAMREVEIMDVEPQGEAARELVRLDAQAPSPQAHPQAIKQSANEKMARDCCRGWAHTRVTGIGRTHGRLPSRRPSGSP